MKERIKEIEAKLIAFKKDVYQKREVLPELFALQDQIVSATFNGEHAERSQLRLFDVARHFEQINSDCGNIADELLAKFNVGSKKVSEMIKADISGGKGEQKAYKSLQTIRRNHRLLKNIELKMDDHRTEIDIITVTNNAIFLIEVKNTSKDIVIDERGNYCRVAYNGELAFDKNIGEKMNEKEYLLREVLRKAGIEDVRIVSLVVFTNSSIKVTNKYEYIKECYLSQLPHIVDGYVSGNSYNDKQMMRITQAILDAQCKEAYPIEMDMAEFKTTFATLMATLEAAKAKQAAEEEIIARRKKNPFFNFFNRLSKVACLLFN